MRLTDLCEAGAAAHEDPTTGSSRRGLLLDQSSSPVAHRSGEHFPLKKVMRSKPNKNGYPSMTIEKLADVLIASRCGTHSLGLVYEFLLKTHGNPKEARADFVRFLSGELPARLRKEAQLWISEEQGCGWPASIDEDPTAPEVAGDSSCARQAPRNRPYEPIQANW